MQLTPRARILTTAHDLFYRDGIRATGIDKVISESGVAKATFYRHFPSKNALVEAFLAYRHERWMTWFQEALQRHGSQAGGGLSPVLPTLREWFKNPVFRGCAFINCVAELGGSQAQVIAISAQHKQDMTLVLAELLPAIPQRIAIAQAVALAVDGAIVRAQLEDVDSETSSALESLALVLAALQPQV